MKDKFNQYTGAAASASPPDDIDIQICSDLKEDLRTKDVLLITVKSFDEAIDQIAQHPCKKIFFITSGTLGRYIVPVIVSHYPQVHSFYIYCHNIGLHVDCSMEYRAYLQMFDHQVDLLVRLTRDIASYFIEQGRIYLQIQEPIDALTCFKHAQTLEIQENKRDKMESNKSKKTHMHNGIYATVSIYSKAKMD